MVYGYDRFGWFSKIVNSIAGHKLICKELSVTNVSDPSIKS